MQLNWATSIIYPTPFLSLYRSAAMIAMAAIAFLVGWLGGNVYLVKHCAKQLVSSPRSDR